MIFDQSQNIHQEFPKFNVSTEKNFRATSEAMISKPIAIIETKFSMDEKQIILVENTLNEFLMKMNLQKFDSKARLATTDFLIKNSSDEVKSQINKDIQDLSQLLTLYHEVQTNKLK